MQAYASTAIKPNKTKKPYKGLGMEGAVARWYAALTKKSLVEFETLARRVAGEISPGSSVLEVAPGPGYIAIELAKLGDYRVTGLDISATFVEIARSNAASANVQAQFQRGDASRMPFDGERFDYIVCRAAFKNFSAPVAALQEMCRVLKPGGRALILNVRQGHAAGRVPGLDQAGGQQHEGRRGESDDCIPHFPIHAAPAGLHKG